MKRRPVPGKARVHELAKELGIDSKTVLAKLKEQGEFVKSASSTVEAPVARRLREAYTGGGAPSGPGNGASGARPGPRPSAPTPGPRPVTPQAPAASAPAPAAPTPSGPRPGPRPAPSQPVVSAPTQQPPAAPAQPA